MVKGVTVLFLHRLREEFELILPFFLEVDELSLRLHYLRPLILPFDVVPVTCFGFSVLRFMSLRNNETPIFWFVCSYRLV